MKDDSLRVLKTVKYSAIAVGVLTVAGILTVMFLAEAKSGDDGDIAGVVAPALLLTCVSRGRRRGGCPSRRAQRTTPTSPIA